MLAIFKNIKFNSFNINIILFLLILLTYSNSFHKTFFLDDIDLFLNPDNLGTVSYKQIFLEGYKGFYRPVSASFIKTIYDVIGNNPAGYNLLNICLFYVICALFYAILSNLFKNNNLAFLTVILYSIHPINNFFVNYKTASYLLCYVICVQICTLTFIKYLDSARKKYLIVSILFYFLSLLSHEISFILPIYLFLIMLFLPKFSFRKTVYSLLPFVIVFIPYLFLRLNFSARFSLSKILSLHINLFQYISTVSRLILWYLSKLVLPLHLVFLWDERIDFQLIPFCFFWLGLMTVAILFFMMLKRKNNVTLFGSLVFFSGFIPIFLASFSHSQLTETAFIEPQWFAFSSIGFFIVVSKGLLFIHQKINRKLFVVSLLIVIFALIVLTRHNNSLWKDDKTYCTHWLKLNALNGVTWHCVAQAHIREYDRGLDQKRYNNCDELSHLALSYEILGNSLLGLEYVMQSFKLNPRCAKAYFVYSLIGENLKQEDKKQEALRRAKLFGPQYMSGYEHLRSLFTNSQEINSAHAINSLYPFDRF